MVFHYKMNYHFIKIMFEITPSHFLIYFYNNEYDINTRKEQLNCCIFDVFVIYYSFMIIASSVLINIESISLLAPIIIINGFNVIRSILTTYNFFETYKKDIITKIINILCVICVLCSIAYCIIALFEFSNKFDTSITYILSIIQLCWIYVKYVWLIMICVRSYYRSCTYTTPLTSTRTLRRQNTIELTKYSTVIPVSIIV